MDGGMPLCGKEKEERSLTLVDFEVDKEEIDETDVFRECERAWLCLGWPMVIDEGRPFPSLKDSN